MPITSEMLKVTLIPIKPSKTFENKYQSQVGKADNLEGSENFLFTITEAPEFGKLQFRFQTFYEDLTGPYASLNKFTQKDIDEGSVYRTKQMVY